MTPARALEHLRELSADVRAGVLLKPDGTLAAHGGIDLERAARLGELTRELMDRADAAAARAGVPAAQVEVSTQRGTVFALREPGPEAEGGGWTLAVVAERFALPSLMFYDLRKVLSDLRRAAA